MPSGFVSRVDMDTSDLQTRLERDFPEYADLLRALASAPERTFPSVESEVRTAAELLSALPDRSFPSVEPEVRAAAALLSVPSREFPSVADRVLADIRSGDPALPTSGRRSVRRHALRRWVARAYRPALAAAAAVAVAAFLLRPGVEAPVPSPVESSDRVSGNVTVAMAQTDPAEAESWQPASLGLRVLQALDAGADPRSEMLRTAASWFRTHQAPDGTFAGETQAPNLALPALAMLRLYETGEFPELFTPIDGAIGAVRSRLGTGETTASGEALLASVLARADDDGWPDVLAGDLRRSLRRLVAAGDPRLSAVASAGSFDEKKTALLAYCESRI